METTPYQAPAADLQTASAQEYDDNGILTFKGRIGRLRYLAYSGVANFVIMIPMMLIIVASAGSLDPEDPSSSLGFLGAMVIFYPIMFFFMFMFMIRRLHDLNQSGWLSLLSLIPFVNLLFGLYVLFASGSEQANRFGAPPRPNSTGIYILALTPIVIGVIGVIAAIALPAMMGAGLQ